MLNVAYLLLTRPRFIHKRNDKLSVHKLLIFSQPNLVVHEISNNFNHRNAITFTYVAVHKLVIYVKNGSGNKYFRCIDQVKSSRDAILGSDASFDLAKQD